MQIEVLVAVLSFAGTLIGTLTGVLTSARLTTYRLEQLEKKVEKHNNLVERMVAVEKSAASAHKRLDDLH